MVQSCTIEYLPNIRQLCILIPINVDNTDTNTKLYLNREAKRLHTNHEDDKGIVLISVPGLVTVKDLEIPIEGDLESIPHVHRIDNGLIVQFRNVQPSGVQATLEQLPNSKELQAKCTELSCVSCGKCLQKFEAAQFKDLPNEHWLELLDCWSCHDNEFAPIAERALQTEVKVDCNSKKPLSKCSSYHDSTSSSSKCSSYHDINNSSTGLILPSEGKIYVGNGHVLMNRKDFAFQECPKCKVEIGEFVQTDHIKIYRDCIKFSGFSQESFLSILMHRILDTIDNHSTFHFILKAQNSKDKIYLRPINWNLQFYDLDSGKWKVAFKLGYSLIPESAHLDAETINCTSAQFHQISSHLRYAHESLLFNSYLKIPGSEVLKLVYLIS